MKSRKPTTRRSCTTPKDVRTFDGAAKFVLAVFDAGVPLSAELTGRRGDASLMVQYGE